MRLWPLPIQSTSRVTLRVDVDRLGPRGKLYIFPTMDHSLSDVYRQLVMPILDLIHENEAAAGAQVQSLIKK